MTKAISSEAIRLPKGGDAQYGIEEKFSSDLHTGTGNCTVSVDRSSGRNGFQPQINLVYNTGNGSSGIGWNLSIPGVSRKTSKGIPPYDDTKDVFVPFRAEALVPIEISGMTVRYRPEPKDCSRKPFTAVFFSLAEGETLNIIVDSLRLFLLDGSSVGDLGSTSGGLIDTQREILTGYNCLVKSQLANGSSLY